MSAEDYMQRRHFLSERHHAGFCEMMEMTQCQDRLEDLEEAAQNRVMFTERGLQEQAVAAEMQAAKNEHMSEESNPYRNMTQNYSAALLAASQERHLLYDSLNQQRREQQKLRKHRAELEAQESEKQAEIQRLQEALARAEQAAQQQHTAPAAPAASEAPMMSPHEHVDKRGPQGHTEMTPATCFDIISFICLCFFVVPEGFQKQ